MLGRSESTTQHAAPKAFARDLPGDESVLFEDADGSSGGPSEGLLGSTAKSVGQIGRAARFRHQRHAAHLLEKAGRISHCRWSVVSKADGVDVVTSRYGEDPQKRAHYEGLQTCGSVWLCPCCSARISETRRGELNDLLAWARRHGHAVKMLTLTARHGRDDDLGDLLTRMKAAKKSLAQHRTYKALKPVLIGSVTATEVTGGGAHGWHPHFHVIMVFREETDLEALRAPWLASLAGAGLDGGGAAFDVQDAAQAGSYIAKWGAAEEMALSGRKKGRAGRTPMQLLADSCDEADARAGHLWREFAEAFRGRRQLVWSRGLKAMVGIGEIKDEEAARDEAQADQIEDGRANMPYEAWRAVARTSDDRRAALLTIAEEDGPEAAAAAALQASGGSDDDDWIGDDPIDRAGGGDGGEGHPRGVLGGVRSGSGCDQPELALDEGVGAGAAGGGARGGAGRRGASRRLGRGQGLKRSVEEVRRSLADCAIR